MPKHAATAVMQQVHCKTRLADGRLKPKANDKPHGAQLIAYSDWQTERLSQTQTCGICTATLLALVESADGQIVCPNKVSPSVATLSGKRSGWAALQDNRFIANPHWQMDR